MEPSQYRKINRRQFLKLMGISGLSLLLTRCGIRPENSVATTSPTPGSPSAPAATATPKPTNTPAPTATATPSYRSWAAIGRIPSYDLVTLRGELRTMLDNLGGLTDLIKPGARVGIKPNLTGGTWGDAALPAPATELFATHPLLVQALAELLIDAGASQVYIMDGLGDPAIFSAWGYEAIAKPLGAQLIDLCLPNPYPGYFRIPVGEKYLVYETLAMNGILKELDVFISVAKMKTHSTTGVTLALKNLIGIAPTSEYRRDPTHNHRSAFHESTEFDRRLPRVVIDLNLARPVHLAIIDGILTADGGAGSWDTGYGTAKPGLLVASKDPVAADAVATALMGFDPAAQSGTKPFQYADNHIRLAQEAGLGTSLLSEIGIQGPQIQDVLFPFRLPR